MTRQHRLILSFTAVALATVGLVATAAAHRPWGGGEGREHALAMDKNGDKAVSEAEAAAFFAGHAAQVDGNADGTITIPELEAFRAAKRRERQAERFGELDTNRDGKVSTAEFADSRTAWLMARDADGDGEVALGEGRRSRRGQSDRQRD